MNASPRGTAVRGWSGRAGRRAAFRWAAGLFLVGGAAAAAVLGSSIGRRADRASMPFDPAGNATGAATGGVVRALPEEGRIAIAVTTVAPGTRIEIGFGRSGEVAIEADGWASPHFRAARGSVELDLGGTPGTLRIDAPASLREGTLRIDGRPVARFDGGALVELERVEGITITPRPPG